MLDPDSIPRLLTAGTIEVAPLAYMRGRTLNDAFIILDEAQNTSMEQMKMFLTRLGFGSKMVVTGDITQVDLPGGTRSGLRVVRAFSTRSTTSRSATSPITMWCGTSWSGRIVAAYDRFEADHADASRRSRLYHIATPSGSLGDGRDDPSATGSSDVSIDISNESGIEADNAALVRLATLCARSAQNPSARGTVDPARGRGHHERLPREVPRRARADRCAELSDG